jgi:hypothetical protein
MTDREDKIRQRAYSIWEQEGHPHGRHEDHWHRAAAEVASAAPAQGELIPEIADAPSLQPDEAAPAKKPAPQRRKAATGAKAAPKGVAKKATVVSAAAEPKTKTRKRTTTAKKS